jgi:hypothetical protein
MLNGFSGAPRRLRSFFLWALCAAAPLHAQSVTVSPTSLAFGNLALNATFAKSVTLTNNDSVSVSLTGVTFTNPAFTTVSGGSCGTVLVAGHSCTYKVAFTPTSLTPYSATLSINDSDSSSPQQVSLTGTGAYPATLTITNPSFGNQVVTTTSATKTATLANNQTVALNLITPSGTGGFAVVSGGTCGATLAARSYCTLLVQFTPEAVGALNGSVSVSDDAPNSPQTVSLTGTGTTTGISSITVTPGIPVLLEGNTQQFVATGNRTSGNLNLTNVVTWTSSNTNAATIAASGLASGVSPGTTTVKAVLTSALTSATLLTVTGPNAPCVGPCVLSYHNDNARDGVYSTETILNPSNVVKTKFGRVASITGLNGQIYAQPLFMSGLYNMSSRGNVLYVATEANYLYAFDADTYALLWGNSYMPLPSQPVASGVRLIETGASGDMQCTNITPNVGITSTPVIDPNTTFNPNPVIYFVTREADNVPPNNVPAPNYYQWLHAVDAVTGVEVYGGPVQITTPSGSPESFNPLMENQRAGLALTYDASGNPQIYISWASHCDRQPFRGWMMKYSVVSGTLSSAPTAYFVTSQGVGTEGGIWMSGGAPAIDNPVNGNLYVATSNGSYDGVSNWGESVVKLDSNLNVVDWYTPNNWPCLNEIPGNANCDDDRDLGSGGVVLFNVPNGVPEIVSAGKQGEIYALYQSNLGLWMPNPPDDDPATPNANYAEPDDCTTGPVGSGIAQCFPGMIAADQQGTGSFSTPVFWNNTLYTAGSDDALRAFPLNTNTPGTFNTTGSVGTAPTSFGYPGGSLAVSWDGANPTTAVLWALATSGSTNNPPSQDLLRAYTAVPNGSAVNLIYQGSVGPGAVRFAMPIVVNGKVFAAGQGFSGTGTEGQIYIYGLCPCQ